MSSQIVINLFLVHPLAFMMKNQNHQLKKIAKLIQKVGMDLQSCR
jgi:hypothetical protein